MKNNKKTGIEREENKITKETKRALLKGAILRILKEGKDTVILIDGSNINSAMRRIGERLDYKKLKKYFSPKAGRTEAIYYDWKPDFPFLKMFSENSEESQEELKENQEKIMRAAKKESFFQALRYSGISVRNLSSKEEEEKKTDVDLIIANDIDDYASEPGISKIVLCSGDADFAPFLLRAKKKFGKKVVVVSGKEELSEKLREIADEVYFLEDIIEDIKLENTTFK